MNAKAILAIAAVATLAGTAARADDITVDNTPFHSTLTRAEVRADLAAFQKSGVNPWSTRFNPVAQARLDRSRADVRAEYLADRDEVAAITSEDSGSAYLSHDTTAAVPATMTLAGTPTNAQ